MDRIYSALGRFAVRFRWLVVMAWAGGAIAAGALLPSLSSVSQASTSSFLPADAPSQQAAQLASPLQQAGGTQVTVVAARAGTGLTPADQAAISSLDHVLGTVGSVASVRDTARSPDGHAEQISVLAQVGQGLGTKSQADQELVAGLRSAIRETALPRGLQVHLAGPVAASADSNTASGGTGGKLTAFALVFVIVLLVFVFRSLLAPLVTVTPALLVVKIASPLIAEAARHGLQVSQIAQFLLAVLVIGAGADYGLFLIFRVREELRGGVSSADAVVRAVTRVGESISFSAGTVAAALLSLLAASFSIYSDLGVPLAIGIGLTLLAGLTLLPALLAIFGRAAFWPARPGAGTSEAGWWGRIATRIVRRPVAALACGLVVFGALAAGAFAYRPAGLGGAVTAPAGSDSAAGSALLAAYFPQTANNPTGIVFRLGRPAWDDPQVLQTLDTRLAADTHLSKVTGPLNPNGTTITPSGFRSLYAALGPPRSLPADQAADPRAGRIPPPAYLAYQASGQYVSPDGHTVEYAATLAAGDPSTTAAAQAVPAIRAAAQHAAMTAGAAASGVTGQAAEDADVSSLSDSDLRTVIPIAIAVIAVLLALVMRSLIAPLYLIASVVVSYFGALGLTVLLFMKLSGETGLTFILPFLMFIFMLALGEDYNILVMARIREEARDLPLPAAVSRAIGVTGTTVTSAGIILAGTFAVVAVVGGAAPGGSEAIQVGAGLAAGILMDTFVVRTLLVPSAVVLLGRWNWWPSRTTPAAARPPHTSPHHPTLT